MSFEELSHTADIKIRAQAPTLNDLFSEVFTALMQVMYGTARNGTITTIITVDSADIESLLADFLSEVLFASDVNGMVFSHADIEITGHHLTARLHGELFEPEKHSGGTEVKGISYTGLTISHDANGYMVDIVFDV